jgi:hypothetical protein
MIPKTLREKVLVQWINGISRDDIAKSNGISAGAVSGIIRDYRQIDSNFDLAREYVLCLRKYGYEIRELGEANRLAKRLQLLKIKPEQLELFLDKLAEHAFKRGLEPEALIERVIAACILSEQIKIPVEELPPYIEGKRKELLSLKMDIMFKNWEKDDEQRALNFIITQFGDFKTLYEKQQGYERALATVIIQRNNAWVEISQLRAMLNARVSAHGYPQGNPPDGLFM